MKDFIDRDAIDIGKEEGDEGLINRPRSVVTFESMITKKALAGDREEEKPLFPIDVFPRQFITAGKAFSASTGGGPIELAILPIMAVMAQVLGPSWKFKCQSMVRAPLLWFCGVAPPGSGKSPTARPIIEPIFAHQEKLNESFRYEYGLWADRKAKAVRAKQAFNELAPTEQINIVTDSTPEALVRDLCNNKSLLFHSDEIAQLLLGLDCHSQGKPGKGRATMLGLWNGYGFSNRRKSKPEEQSFARETHCIVVGGIQPSKLEKMDLSDNDGLAARLLWSFADCKETGLGTEIPAEIFELWNRMIKVARSLPTATTSVEGLGLKLIDEKVRLWKGTAIELDSIGHGLLSGFYGKAFDQFARLAAMLYGLDCIEADIKSESIPSLGMDLIERAIQLTEYFLTQAHIGNRYMLGKDQSQNKKLQRADAQLLKALIEMAPKGDTRKTAEWSGLLCARGLEIGPRKLGKAFARINMEKPDGIQIEKGQRSSRGKLWKINVD